MSILSPDLRRWLGRVGAVGLGAVLVVAGGVKALDPLGFAEGIRAEGLEIGLPAGAIAVLVIVVEVALGAALVMGLRRLWVLLPTAALVAFFLFLNARSYWRASQGLVDETEACGCFGNLLSRTPAEAFWQDLLMLLPPLLLAFVGRPSGGRTPRVRLAVVALLAVATAVFAWQAPALPLDDLATRLRPGVEMGELCAGRDSAETVRVCLDALMPELEVGRHLLVIASLDNEELREGIEPLNAIAAAGGPSLWVLTDSPEEERMAFFWEYAPAFEIREAPAALLRPLYRTQPRSFLVESGEVVETWSGLPPAVEAAAGGSVGEPTVDAGE